MTRTPVVFAALVATVLGLASPAAAHRLDEYLQATKVAVDADRVVLEIDLTPGANIARRIVALIDTDGDRRVSDDEEARYARDVLASLRMTVDDGVVETRLTAQHFPTVEEMAAGTGTIRVRAEGRAPLSIGRHRFAYVNSNAVEGSVYLVNALVPADPRVALGPPRRDALQRGLAFDYEVSPRASWVRTGWLIGATALFGALVLARRERNR
jgi:hypothetical protein